MKIKWLGHSSFKLTSDKGISIITDPFDESVGYDMPDEAADIVTMSHDHFDHNDAKNVKGDPELLSKIGLFYIKDIPIRGVLAYHDDQQGAKRGMNILYNVEIDGIHICHCGDLGHLLTPEQITDLGKVDILLVPVGGNYTIDGTEAAKVVAQLKPSIAIPMHYKTPAIQFPIEGVDPFLEAAGGGIKLNKNTLMVSQKDLGPEVKIVVMDYK